MSGLQRVARPAIGIETGIFLTLFVAYAYFSQGGGWSQNVRFDQVRAIVEAGRFSIDDHLIYYAWYELPEERKLRQIPLPLGVNLENIAVIANTGDVTEHDGRYYSGKPPGASFAAVPAYFAVHAMTSLLGMETLDWKTLTIGFYLTVAFSVGLAGALAGVGFFRVALALFPDASPVSRAAATFCFGLATLIFPSSTLFFEQSVVTSLLLWSLLFLVAARRKQSRSLETDLALAGFLLGAALTCNYLTAIPIVVSSAYVLTAIGFRRGTWLFGLGLAVPIVSLAAYQYACFGSVLVTSYAAEASFFQTEGLWLGKFGFPSWDILFQLLVSQYRGLFFFNPVLLAACFGWFVTLRRRPLHPEALLCLAVFGMFLVVNASIQGGLPRAWGGGWFLGPRYLVQAAGLFALGLIPAFQSLPRATTALAVLSGGIMLLGTAVDPQPPMFVDKPLTEYVLPLGMGEQLTIKDNPVTGPVSANPIGVYEAWFYRVYPPGSHETRWNSFNLGELIFPESWWSLTPLVFLVAGGIGYTLRSAAGTIPAVPSPAELVSGSP